MKDAQDIQYCKSDSEEDSSVIWDWCYLNLLHKFFAEMTGNASSPLPSCNYCKLKLSLFFGVQSVMLVFLTQLCELLPL